MTQSFFARGVEQYATGYENLAPDDPLLVPPEVEFDSFDKIPRRRGSVFAIAVSALVLAAIGFVTWRSFYYLSKPASSVATASRAMVQTPPASPAPVPMSIAPASQPAMSEPPLATDQAPVADQRQATQPRMTPPSGTPSEPATPPPGATTASPEMVAQPPAATKLPPVAHSAPAAEPQPQLAPTSPAPFRPEPSPSPPPSESAPIIE
jgi:hypothetical protein